MLGNHQKAQNVNERRSILDCLAQSRYRFLDSNESTVEIAGLEETASLVISILNIFFSKVKLPLKFRPFIFGLIGAGTGREKDQHGFFSLKDRDLAIQVMGEEGRTPGAMKQAIKRLRDELESWQKTNSKKLVTIDRGYAEYARDEKGKIQTDRHGGKIIKGIPSRYRLDVWDAVLRRLRKHQLNPNSRFSEAREMVRELERELNGFYTGLDSAGRLDPEKQRKRAFSLALSNIKNIIRFAREDGDDPVVFLMSLVKEAESLIGPDDQIDQWLREQVFQSGND